MSVVAVVGASGFVGGTLVERLWADGGYEVRPLIHSTGSAGRLARHAKPLTAVDVRLKDEVEEALEGCTHVVNCSRGSTEVMDLGLKNLLEVSAAHKVSRFVHLSSTAVYGHVFERRTTLDERAPVRVVRHSYGWKKAKQDERIAKAVRGGLSCVTLCPPNIAGPRSGYFLEIVDTLRAGRFAYVDEGRMPCDLIDVENLAHAIGLALTCEAATGERIFVTNDEPTTWRDVVDGLAASAEPVEPIPTLTLARARELHGARAVRPPSVRRAVKHLVSSDVRSALTKDTLFATLERSAKTLALKLPESTQTWMRGPDPDGELARRPERPLDGIHTRLVTQQLRNAYYGLERARTLLGYEPVVSCEQSLQAFCRWHAAHTGQGSAEWALLRALYAD